VFLTCKGRTTVVNPASEAPAGRVPRGGPADVDAAVAAARAAFPGWAATPSAERGAALKRIAKGLKARQAEVGAAISQEMGSPLKIATAVQVGGPIAGLYSYVTRAALMDEERHIGKTLVVREPIGVCALITPWNYPLHQLVGKLAPALAAGCTVVVKPSSEAPLSSYLFAEVVAEAGLPPGVFNLVSGGGAEVGEALARHPDVDLISFTGSTKAGVRVSEVAAPTVKRVCLELGGKSPLLITEDADIEKAVTYGVQDVMGNSGQSCNTLSRILVPRVRYPAAIEAARAAAEAFVVGDPQDEATQMGPVSSDGQRDRIRDAIRKGLAEGARLVTGGDDAPEGLKRGYYVRPTVFSEVNNGMSVARDEIFGPVACLIQYSGEADGVAIANDTPYGLHAAVWSGDDEHAMRLARQLRAGQVTVNGGAWNYEAPFGGYKQSGNGREWGDEGLLEYVEVKAIRL